MQRRTVTRALLSATCLAAGWAVHATLGVSLGLLLPIMGVAALVVPFAVYRPDWAELAWFQGARTEMKVGRILEGLGPGYVVIHEVDVAGAGTIDHVVIAPTGVFAVAANAYTGLVEVGWDGRLYMGGYDLRGVVEQVKREASALETRFGTTGLRVAVRPVIAFTRAKLDRPREAGGAVALAADALADYVRGGVRVLDDRDRARVRAALMPERDPSLSVRAVSFDPPAGPERPSSHRDTGAA